MEQIKRMSLLLLLWAPRVLLIIAALFSVLFTFDAFDGDDTIWHKLLGWIIHLFPTFILVIILLLSWRWPWTGGILLIALGVFYYFTYAERSGNHIIDIILVSIGALFIASWFLRTSINTARS
jgi:hypothetical protein